MPLTYPMHAVPGEMLVTTENVEDVDYNELWRVPREYEGTELAYGDVLLVISCSILEVDDDNGVRQAPATLLHTCSQRLLHFDDIEDVGWLWRPDPQATEWKRDQL